MHRAILAIVQALLSLTNKFRSDDTVRKQNKLHRKSRENRKYILFVNSRMHERQRTVKRSKKNAYRCVQSNV